MGIVQTHRCFAFWGVVFGLALAALSPVSVLTHDPVSSVSWSRDVEPIARSRCLPCHQPGGPALPVLALYEDYKLPRVAVKNAILSGRMPLSSAMRGFGTFRGELSLSPLQVSLFASWIEAGAPARATNEVAPALTSSPAVGSPSRRVPVHRLELTPF